MEKILLTRKQITLLNQTMEHFKEATVFTITSESLSGIGPTVTVQFDLFGPADTKIDITDLESW